ncbi:MAG: glycosyltransferase family 9 protein [Chlorobi bacterium]|nr:glycosyltransferase family 9 protein [Chlorobiota bacterium]
MIVRTDRIGDLILTLPLAAIVKKHFSGAKISFLVQSYTAELLENHPSIYETLILRGSVSENVSMLKKKKFDAAVVASPNPGLAFSLYGAGIPIRIGTAYRWYSFLFNKRLKTHRKSGDKHELEYNVEMLKPLGIEENLKKGIVPFNLQVDQKSVQSIKEILEKTEYDFSLPTVIIHPGSGGSAVDLPISKFKAIVKRLALELNVNIVVTGNKNETGVANKICANEKTINLAGILSLKELTAMISLSEITAANSTGPIHIAAALGKHCVGFYPDIHSMSPTRWGPYTEKALIFQPEMDCDGLNVDDYKRRKCMDSIDENKIFEGIKELLLKIEKK